MELNENIKLTTSYMAAVNEHDLYLSLDYIKEILHKNSSFTVLEMYEAKKEDYSKEYALQEIVVKLQYLPLMVDIDEEEDDDETDGEYKDNEDEEDSLDMLTFRISIIPMYYIREFIETSFITKELEENKFKRIFDIKTCLSVGTEFENFPILDYQRQLKLLNLLAKESLVFVDVSSLSVKTGSWLQYISTFDIPPSLDYIFSIHAIYEDEKEPYGYWFHTHGLLRAGIPEIEILNVANGDANYGTLIATIAKQFIEFGVPDKGYVFEPAYNVHVTWEDFDNIVEKLPEGTVGGEKDEINIGHHNSSIVIVGMDGDRQVGLDNFEDALVDNPVFSLSNFETRIMRDAANKSLKYFLYFFEKYKEDENYNFLIKLGYGENTKDSEVEHLWFMMYDFDKKTYTCTAALLNEPYYDIGMHEGDTRDHSFERLTDWKIVKEDDYYDSSNIYILFESEDES